MGNPKSILPTHLIPASNEVYLQTLPYYMSIRSQMPLFEKILNYLLKDQRESKPLFIILWLSVAILIYLGYRFAGDILLNNPWLCVISIIPSTIVLLMSMFVSNYQTDQNNLLLPSPFLFSVLTFFGTFGVLKYAILCFALIKKSIQTAHLSSSTALWIIGLALIYILLLKLRRALR